VNVGDGFVEQLGMGRFGGGGQVGGVAEWLWLAGSLWRALAGADA